METKIIMCKFGFLFKANFRQTIGSLMAHGLCEFNAALLCFLFACNVKNVQFIGKQVKLSVMDVPTPMILREMCNTCIISSNIKR